MNIFSQQNKKNTHHQRIKKPKENTITTQQTNRKNNLILSSAELWAITTALLFTTISKNIKITTSSTRMALLSTTH